MSWLDWTKVIGGGIAAPFTGGATLPLALSGVSALAGGLNNRAQTSTSAGTSSTTGTSQTTGQDLGQTHTEVDPNAKALNDALTTKYMSALGLQPDFAGYKAATLGNINHVGDLQRQNLNESLAMRGIQGPAAGGANATLDNNLFGQKTDFLNTAPTSFIAGQLPLFNAAQGFSSSLPRDTYTTNWIDSLNKNTSNTATTGTGTTPGNVAGGALTNGIEALLPWLAKMFGGNSVPKGSTSDVNTGIYS